jgi:aminocarboxymuconate-semialdehyde decarboxylase
MHLASPTIDVHTHYLPAAYVDAESPGADGSAYTVRIADPATGQELFTVDAVATGFRAQQLYDLEVRRGDMQRQGVDLQVLSVPPPIALFYDLEPARAQALCRAVNDAFAQTAASDPEHFIALATLPLQAPDAAVAELERAIRDLGLRGVEIGTNIAGRDLDDPALGPFYARLQELDVPAFIHSTNASALGGKRLHRYHLSNIVGNPTEDALAAASLIFGGVLREFPRLKVYLAHGGGSCPYLLGRWEHGWRVRPEARLHIQQPPSAYFGQLRFDSLTHGGPALNYLVETAGPARVMLGTDYPYDMGDSDPVQSVAALLHVSDRERALILGGNALALFGLDQ